MFSYTLKSAERYSDTTGISVIPLLHTQCPVETQYIILFNISFYLKQHFTVSNNFFWFWFSFAELQSEKEELEKKYIHVLQILESEKTAKWQLLQQCEEQAELVSSLKTEVRAFSSSVSSCVCRN